MKFYCLLFFSLFTLSAFSQEKGILKKPKLPTTQTEKKQQAKDKNFNKPLQTDDEFSFEETPKVRFVNEFLRETNDSTEKIKLVPVKQENTSTDENKATIDEFESEVVEIEPYIKMAGSDQLIKGPSYFAVWDTKRKNPYNLKATDFDEIIPIKLYDPTEGNNWHAPLEKGIVNSEFKWRKGRWHEGVDLDLEVGDPIYAPFDGVVRVTGWDGRGYGNYMILRHHNGIETIHGHLSRINLETNTYFKAGDIIGWGGNTGRSSGPHLHMETLYEGNPFNPRNIFEFLTNKIDLVGQEFILTSQVFDYLRGKSPIVHSSTTTNTEEDQENYEEPQVEEEVKVMWVKVRSGDTLIEIARKHGLSLSELCKLNRVSPRAAIRVGQKLRVL